MSEPVFMEPIVRRTNASKAILKNRGHLSKDQLVYRILGFLPLRDVEDLAEESEPE